MGLTVLVALVSAGAAGRALAVRPVDLGPLCRAVCGAFPHFGRPLGRLAAIHYLEIGEAPASA